MFLPEIAPLKDDLDAVVADRPAVLIAKDMHTFWLNSLALEAAGITSDTQTPSGGVIVRDPDSGEPTGALRDFALDLDDIAIAAIPEPSSLLLIGLAGCVALRRRRK